MVGSLNLNLKPKRLIGSVLALSAGLVFTMEASAMQVGFKINDRTYVQELPDSEAAQSFAAALPVTLTFEDYAATERIAYLPQKLKVSSNVSHTPKRRDITYYVPWGNLAIFTKDFRHSSGLMYIGTLDEEVLKAIEESGDSPVTISVN